MSLQSYEKEKMPGARPWNISVVPTDTAGNIARQRGCFAVMYTNIGDVRAWANGMVLNPLIDPVTLQPLRGETVTFAGHREDLYKGNLDLKFDPASLGVAPLVEVVQLFYTDMV